MLADENSRNVINGFNSRRLNPETSQWDATGRFFDEFVLAYYQGTDQVVDKIEVFAPEELRKLFAACGTPVEQRGKWRDRETMIPYLAIAAFCGLRSAEIARLD